MRDPTNEVVVGAPKERLLSDHHRKYTTAREVAKVMLQAFRDFGAIVTELKR